MGDTPSNVDGRKIRLLPFSLAPPRPAIFVGTLPGATTVHCPRFVARWRCVNNQPVNIPRQSRGLCDWGAQSGNPVLLLPRRAGRGKFYLRPAYGPGTGGCAAKTNTLSGGSSRHGRNRPPGDTGWPALLLRLPSPLATSEISVQQPATEHPATRIAIVGAGH